MFPANHLQIVLASLAHMSQLVCIVTFSFERPNIFHSCGPFQSSFMTL